MARSRLGRRDFLARCAALGLPMTMAISAPFPAQALQTKPGSKPTADNPAPDDPRTLEQARERFRKAGLTGAFSATRTNHFQGAGNAAPAFIGSALTLCERLNKDYRDHFTNKGFVIAKPKAKMTVIVLADLSAFHAFLGQDLGPETAGVYDLEANWLAMFDNRPKQPQGRPSGGVAPERVNGFVLIHEAFHLLNYNTDLLSRDADVPLCVSEGLAAYAETRRADGKTPIGRINAHRLQALAIAQRGGVAWIPLPRLLVEDALFEADETNQAAYAQSWILIHDLLQSKTKAPKLRAYLEAIRNRKDHVNRLKDAQTHLGDLDKLDDELRKSASKQLRRG